MRDHYDFSHGIKNPYADKLKKQIKLEYFEKSNKIKAEQNAIKKRIESERAKKNLSKNVITISKKMFLIHLKKILKQNYQIIFIPILYLIIIYLSK